MLNTLKPALSLAGTPAASPLGYYSWTFGQAARDPLYIMVIIYIFFPYFSNVVVGDPVRGQTIIGYLNTGAGFFMAMTIPVIGAIADNLFEALSSGDTDTVRALFAPDILIFESGNAETSLEEYAGHHMPADMAFLAAMDKTLLSRQVIAGTDIRIWQ